MSSTDPFKLLGLKRGTATEADVKRAYAKKLKETRPDEDRAGFMALRQAFTAARNIAKGNDTRRAAEVEAEAAPAEAEVPKAEGTASPPTPKPKAAPKPQAQPDLKWVFHKDINWNCRTDAQGELILRSLRWMKASGPDADAFVADFKSTLEAHPEIDRAALTGDMLAFLQVQGTKDDSVYDLPDWEEFELIRPDWLSDEMIRLLCGPLGLFDHAPTEAWRARNFNMARTLFMSVLPDNMLEVPEPKDPKAIFAQHQTEHRRDEHGSYFDAEKMAWVDMAPVSVAMRDIQAVIDRGLWDGARRIKDILNRDEVQPLDEFQDLDARLRQLICNATGQFDRDKRRPDYPAWLTKDLLMLLEETFGWSHQYGRHDWERRQFDWLHRVLSRDITIDRPAAQFQAQQAPQRSTARPRPAKPNPIAVALAGLYAKPHRLLLGYFGYRVLQFLVRLAV